jgi:hypothetical protein
MTNIRPLARGHRSGVLLISAHAQHHRASGLADGAPIFFLAWQDFACSFEPYGRLMDAMEALLAIEREVDAQAIDGPSIPRAAGHEEADPAQAGLAELWATVPEVDWATVPAARPHPAVVHRLGRSLQELGRVVVFSAEDIELLRANELLPETANVTAQDVAFTLVEAIEAEGTASPERKPYSL